MADTTPTPTPEETTPTPEEGIRPEAEASVVRPEEEEANGPLPGLVATAAASVAYEATGSPEAEEELEALGVEEEGIASGQILGITIAIIASVFLLSFSVFWAFYVPKLTSVEDEAEGLVDLSAEIQTLRATANARIADYSLTADSVYTVPIGVAMQDVAARYAGASGASDTLAVRAPSDGQPLASSRAGFNVAPIALAPQRAVREASTGAAPTVVLTDAPADGAAPEAAGDEDAAPSDDEANE